jgi:hypothetical protein
VKSSLLPASVALCVSLALPACGGSQPPIGAADTLSRQSAGGAPAHGRSWMVPEAKRSKLLYVSYFYGNDVFVYTYPGGQSVGMITGIPEAQGECTSKESGGNWWVVATGANEVLEFAHGGTTPILTINTMSDQPGSCAVDPTTGNVAVTMLTTSKVVIYTSGGIDGTAYATPFEPFFSGYDPKGNLYIDGSGMVARLSSGGTSFEPITLNQGFIFPGGVQWHEGLLAIGDQDASNVYEYKIHGTNGTLERTTPLNGGGAGGFWIQGKQIIAEDAGNIGIWNYPAGGSPFQTISAGFYGSIDATVSLPR